MSYVRFWVLGLVLLLAASCKVEFDESMHFYCENHEDCGGDGYRCKPNDNNQCYCSKDDNNACRPNESCSNGKCR